MIVVVNHFIQRPIQEVIHYWARTTGGSSYYNLQTCDRLKLNTIREFGGMLPGKIKNESARLGECKVYFAPGKIP